MTGASETAGGNAVDAAAPLALTVLTVNTHMGFGFFNRRFVLPELRDAIRTVSADVVFLQEVLGAHAVRSRRHANWPDASHYEFLADEIWPQFAYGRNAVYPAGHHGNALLSKLPIVRHENRDVTTSRGERRGLLHCVLKAPGRDSEIHTVCVHLGLREAQRRRQLSLLSSMIDDELPRDAPLIVAGDFNDWRETGNAALLRRADLREAFVEAGGRPARTFPARFPLLRLDRVYLRNARILRAEVLAARPWSHLSDHAPLVVRVAL